MWTWRAGLFLLVSSALAVSCSDVTVVETPECDPEICDGLDNNCDGEVDEGVLITYYEDQDGDGRGDGGTAQTGCDVPADSALEEGDCDDTDPDISPEATEVCDEIDNNCDGTVDEGVVSDYYDDRDGDGFGDDSSWVATCAPPSEQSVAVGGDCDDQDAAIHPGVAERCDGLDDNCDGQVDEADSGVVDGTPYYEDQDGDGFGDSASSIQACMPPTNYVAVAGDCNDSNSSVNPEALEECDGLDNNCDEIVDDVPEFTFYQDADGDGFGSPYFSVEGCEAPDGYVDNSLDCDDVHADINPEGAETCNDLDDDCDDLIDEDVSIIDLDGGFYHSLALCSSGEVLSWGSNDSGQLGDDTDGERFQPTIVAGPTSVVAVAAGLEFSLALTSEGTVWSWGANQDGQLGDGSTDDRSVATPIDGLAGIKAIAAGYAHALAADEEGKLWAWGNNDYGQLGLGNTGIQLTPSSVGSIDSVRQVAAGEFHSAALVDSGQLWAWGRNNYGQVGDGSGEAELLVPTEIGLGNLVDLVCGSTHTLGLSGDGTVYAWGFNGKGQLGDDSTTARDIPQLVPGLSDVLSLAAGDQHSAALQVDGAIWNWGLNSDGQLGIGSTSNSKVPVQVQGSLGSGVLIAAGRSHSLAVDTTQRVWAWGKGNNGQLGTEDSGDQKLPILIETLP